MRLNFKSFGSGTPVIILHGLFGSLDNWQTFARKLSAGFHVFTVDLRNHGRSPHSTEHSYEAIAADMHDFFEEHQIEKAHIIGHSMGGKAAMQFAHTYPEKILTLIVVDIAAKEYHGGHDNIFEALLHFDLSKVKSREDADAMLALKIEEQGVRQFLLKNLDRNSDGTFTWKMNLNALHRNYEKINRAIHPVQPVPLPAFLIRGDKSGYVRDEDMHDFKRIFPKAQFITIPHAGHWVHADAPEAFYNAVSGILKS